MEAGKPGNEGNEGGEEFTPDARGRLMQEVAEQMDAIEADHGENFTIGRVVTIVEVGKPNNEVEVRVRAQMLPWVAIGLLQAAQKSIGG